jgi:hypothetical protein
LRKILSLSCYRFLTYIVSDQFERRDGVTYYLVKCQEGERTKWALQSPIRRGAGRCDCQKKSVKSSERPIKAEKPPRYRFPEEACQKALAEYRETGSDRAYAEFQRLIYPMIERLANKRQIFKFMEQEEAIQEIYIKIWKATRVYDRNRGRLYSFLCCVINNRLSQT